MLLLWVLPGAAPAQTSTTANAEEVEVDFMGDTEVAAGDEVEVTFTEEINRSELDDLPPLPEYHYSRWLLALPVICALVLAWNVRWKAGPRRHERRQSRKS